MKRVVAFVAVAAVAWLASACVPAPGGEMPCTMQYVYGLNVYVTNAVTGAPLDGVSVTAVDGSYVENLESFPGSPGAYTGAGERPGTYTVTAVLAGYQPSLPQTVTLGFDGCHVIPATLNFALNPE